MLHQINDDFLNICSQIIGENRSVEEWAGIESDDMFQEGIYTGGFDATEMEFTFSVFIDQKEYWFQLPLSIINKIASEEISTVILSPAIK